MSSLKMKDDREYIDASSVFEIADQKISSERALQKMNAGFSIALYKLHFHLESETFVSFEEGFQTEELKNLYEKGLKESMHLLDDFFSEKIDRETYARFLYYMALSAFRYRNLEIGMQLIKDAHNLTSAKSIKFETLSEYVGIISFMKLDNHDSHIRFLSSALAIFFNSITSPEAFIEVFNTLYKKSSGDVTALLAEIYNREKESGKLIKLHEENISFLEKDGYKSFAKYIY